MRSVGRLMPWRFLSVFLPTAKVTATSLLYSVNLEWKLFTQDPFVRQSRRWLFSSLYDEKEDLTMSSEARMLFNEVFNSVETKFGKDLTIPREIVWLNGAPGSGKGANTPFMLKSRGLARAISMSSLLAESSDALPYMDRGELIPEDVVLESLLSEVLDPTLDNRIGLLVDGYPRTPIQVDSLKLLHDRLMMIYNERKDRNPELIIAKPSFKLVVLYVTEDMSIHRQQKRGIKATTKSQRAIDAGSEYPKARLEVRSTDLDESYCRKRYSIFKAHYSTLLRLKKFFPFHIIDAMGSLEATRTQITRELRYQSSTDLEAVTYDAIRHLPMAKELSRISRQTLSTRLDTYAMSYQHIFKKTIEIIDQSVLPILKRAGMAGEAKFISENEIFSESPLSVDILIDVLSDRGFHVTYVQKPNQIVAGVDLKTGSVECRNEISHVFKIRFPVGSIRDLGDNDLEADGDAEAAFESIGMSFMPEGTDHQQKYRGRSNRESVVADKLLRRTGHQQKSDLPTEGN